MTLLLRGRANIILVVSPCLSNADLFLDKDGQLRTCWRIIWILTWYDMICLVNVLEICTFCVYQNALLSSKDTSRVTKGSQWLTLGLLVVGTSSTGLRVYFTPGSKVYPRVRYFWEYTPDSIHTYESRVDYSYPYLVMKMESQDGLPWNTLFRRKPVSTK